MHDGGDPHASYLDFELEIDEGRGGEYPVTVLGSPHGEAREAMRFPFDDAELKHRLRALQSAVLHPDESLRGVLTWDSGPEEQYTVRDFGLELFNGLFTGEVRNLYDLSRRIAQQQGDDLRLKLRILPPALAVVPWEFMYDPRVREFVCLYQNNSLVRYLELPQPVQRLSVGLPLRILGMVADPRGSLDVEGEKQRVEEAIANLRARELVDLTWVLGQTWRDLQREIRRAPWHIFHFIGHGGFDRQGFIALADEEGQEHRLRANQLARLLTGCRSLRLGLLNACEGARGSAFDVLSSTAATLMGQGVPAVLAMQYQITDRAALEFARTFYETLAEGQPVDTAVTAARLAVDMECDRTAEWGTPVLYMRSSDGVLFDLRREPAGPSEPVPEPPPAEEPPPQPVDVIPPEDAPRIFLSYTRVDAGQVRSLYGRLSEAGFRPWMDKVDILPGELWENSIERAIRESDFFLVCLSPNSVNRRGQIQREIKQALDLWEEKLEDDIFLIPARLEDCEVPETLSSFQWVDLFLEEDWDMLVRAVRVGMERRAKSETARQKAEAELRRTPGGLVIATPENLKDLLSLPKPPERVWWERAEMEFRLVPAGEFLMGSADSDKDAGGDEKPQHRVYLDAYYIGRYPVTNKQYARLIQDTGYKTPEDWDEKQTKESYPVVNVSWHDAQAYCEWAGLRLPTEAEWEKAASWDAKAGRKRLYPWGDKWDAGQCNTSEGGKGGTTPVGAYSPAGDSPYGCADMAGNVWEWVADWYGEGYYKVSPGRNPLGPDSGDSRVLRGGSWYVTRYRARSAYRSRNYPDVFDYWGFRCCLPFTFSL